MSTPAHLWLTDENDSPIVGGCMMPTRLGSIEPKTLTHNVSIPVDPNYGKLTGTRVHSPSAYRRSLTKLRLFYSAHSARGGTLSRQ